MIAPILAGVLMSVSVSSPPAPVGSPPLAQRFDEVRDRFDLPSLAGFAMKGDEIVAIAAVGVRALGDEAVVTTDDRWHIGSCGKAMSATVLDQVVARGDLAWGTTVGDVFGDFEEILPDWHDVTLRRLVQHRAGLPDDRQEHLVALRKMPIETSLPDKRLELVRLVFAEPPIETDGSEMRYSNFGYVVAAAMAERRTGRDWESLTRELLFEPLAMSQSGFGAPGSVEVIDQPRGHRNGIGIAPSRWADNPSEMAPAGTIHATMADWSEFLAAHLDAARGDAGAFDPIRLQGLQRPPAGGDYAPGWMVLRRDWAKGPILMHSGSNTLWYSVVWMAPSRDWVMAALANVGGAKAAQACDAAIGILMGELKRLDSVEVETGPGSM